MKRFICAAIVLTILWITSCTAAVELTDEEAIAILSDLIPRSAELNEIFWGEGLPTVDYDEDDLPISFNWYYVEVTPDCKYQSINDIEAAASQVFTYGFLQIIYSWAFFGSYELKPRYSENDDGVLQRNVMDNGFELTTVFHIDQAKVKSGKRDSVTVTVPADVQGEPYGDVDLVLIKENGVWLLDSPTY